MTKLLRDEISMIEAVEVMSRRIKELEADKLNLQDLLTKSFAAQNLKDREQRSIDFPKEVAWMNDRIDLLEADKRRVDWLQGHPSTYSYFEGYWYYVDGEVQLDSLREVIDYAIEDSKENQ